MGNAGNISHRLETLQLLHDLGVTTFIFDYRGYGLSKGKASEAGLYHDAAGAMLFLRERGWTADRIIIFGRLLTFYRPYVCLEGEPTGILSTCL